MMFSPRNYTNLVELKENSIGGAHSDTSIDGMDVFGFFEGNAYACKYDMDADVAYAGDCIDIVEGEDHAV
jgi:hypothetical protein